ncbi:hypothetical protein B0H14DRAFT_2657018 [Mycena olivaceomarginata]|nr:hypothetical protein B0H14DRAFT_2657018 [Mycena olivaceomarginata]
MSSSTTSHKLDKPALTDEDKRRKHAEAQHKYREKNLEATREKARERMGRLCEGAKPLKRRLERQQRQSRDADYREAKFLAEFGVSAFYDYYFAHQRLLGVDELPGISRQYRKDMANAPEAHKEKDGFLVYSYRNLRPQATNPASVAAVPIQPKLKRDAFLCPSPPPSHLHGLDLPGSLLPQPHKLHDGLRARRQRAQVMVPCSPCWAVYKTLRTDTEHQADVSGAPVFTFRTRAEAEAYWAANCRKNHPHNDEGSEEDGSPPPFSTPARSASRSAPVNAVRASVKRETPVKDKVEEAKTPLFREDSEVSPLSRPRKHPSPASPPSSRKHSTSASVHSVSPMPHKPNLPEHFPAQGSEDDTIAGVPDSGGQNHPAELQRTRKGRPQDPRPNPASLPAVSVCESTVWSQNQWLRRGARFAGDADMGGGSFFFVGLLSWHVKAYPAARLNRLGWILDGAAEIDG